VIIAKTMSRYELEQFDESPPEEIIPEDSMFDPIDHGQLGHDNLSLGEYGTPTRRAMNHGCKSITEVDQDERDRRVLKSSVEIFLEACGKNRPLPQEEVVELIDDYQYRGDLDAKEKVIRHNLGLVVHVAKEVRRTLKLPSTAMGDLLQDGTTGLIRAAELYDHNRGTMFSSYACKWIRNRMIRAQDNTGDTIRIPVHVHEQRRQVGRVYYDLCRKLGYEPSETQIATYLGIDLSVLEDLRLTKRRQPLSLDRYIGKDDDGMWQSRQDTLVQDADSVLDEVAAIERRQQIQKELAKLPCRKREILELRYGLEDDCQQTLEEIGQQFVLSRERVRQIEDQTLKEMERRIPRSQFADGVDNLTPEEVRGRGQSISNMARYITFTDFISGKAREYTQALIAKKEQSEEERQEEERLQRARRHIEGYYEDAMRERATLATTLEAGGRLRSREDFYAERYTIGPERLPVWDGTTMAPATYKFLQEYGRYASVIFDALYKGLQACTADTGATVGLAELEDFMTKQRKTFFDVHPQFLSAVLEAGERQGAVFCDRSSSFTRYRLRKPSDDVYEDGEEKMEQPHDVALPETVQDLLDVMKAVGAGYGKDTAITFAQLRRYWGEKRSDPNETRLRTAMYYLQEAGLVEMQSSQMRGHDIWLRPMSDTNGETVNYQQQARNKYGFWQEDKARR
jgi:RNA polymerase primary sigma factor